MICKKCDQEKSIDNFRYRKDRNKYHTCCKECESKIKKDWYNNNIDSIKNKYYFNKDKKLKNQHDYYIRNKDKIKKRSHEYYENNKDKVNKSNSEWKKKNHQYIKNNYKIYYIQNKDRILLNNKIRRLKNIEKDKTRHKLYAKNNPDKIKGYYKKNIIKIKNRMKQYRENNKEYFNKYHKIYYKERRKNDIYFKLSENFRKRILVALKKHYKKSKKSQVLLGCSIQDLKKWLGIIGNNYNSSKLQIDHIIPCALYDLSKENEQLKCFNYRNLRLYSAKENLLKRDKLDYDLIKLYQIQDLLPEGISID